MSDDSLPAWADLVLVPLLDIAAALGLACLLVWLAGVSPAVFLAALVRGALGDSGAIGYTLFYATSLTFTGLAVALAMQGGLFNIGGEGQAMLGGIGATLVALSLDAVLPGPLVLLLAIPAAALAGAAWAAGPAWLQATRGSHVVVTTILFNFMAAALLAWLLVSVLIAPGSMAPETRAFADGAAMPRLHEWLAAFGIAATPSPLNASLLLALAAAGAVWLLVWRTRLGYAIRVMGQSPGAARYAGIPARRLTVICLCLSGALAGLAAVNEILGAQHRLMLNFTAGSGFAGIAVALMGRNHPAGIVAAAILFGMLYQGGAEITFDIPALTRETVLVIQGLVILFAGALAGFTRPAIRRLLRARAA